MKPTRRLVRPVEEQPNRFRAVWRGWAFGFDALAATAGVSYFTVWREVESGALNPASLADVVRWVNSRRTRVINSRRHRAKIPAT